MRQHDLPFVLTVALVLAAIGSAANEASSALTYARENVLYNAEAPIPPQCYTKTDGRKNPCYVCHQSYPRRDERTNLQRDGWLQGEYAFSEVGETNRWSNLFVDRVGRARDITDAAVADYIDEDNYTPFIAALKANDWQGPMPEIAALADGARAFDEHGLALDGSHWVAFNYKPLPSTFWPTNGSTDDVMIRLDAPFRQTDGVESRDVYYANLALLEIAMVDLRETTTPPLDERRVGVDLDGDGMLTTTTRIVRRTNYVGDAAGEPLTHMLYPAGIEFLHTVRYIDVAGDGANYPSRRMKEVRYMRKSQMLSVERLRSAYYFEVKEKNFEKLPQPLDKGVRGMSNRMGWTILGFIEDADGALRQQTREEQFACVGCHKAIGSTIDQTFAFPRKRRGREGWTYVDYARIPDVPNVGETKGEFATYLERVGGGDEFRRNVEVLERWFESHEDGRRVRATIADVAHIGEIVWASRERALELNRAYMSVVREQSYIFGRDIGIEPATNVLEAIDTTIAPLEDEFRYEWDIRLDWTGADNRAEADRLKSH